MIVKKFKEAAHNQDPRIQAGIAAEKQMAHYLHRFFSDDPNIFVLHGLRLEDPAQPEHDDSTGVCQIDHLLVHRFGFFIIECKSVTGEVQVRSDGSGGDEWTRVNDHCETGMPSPIQQARRQSEFLRKFLYQHAEELVGRLPFGIRTVARLIYGTDQRGFARAPIQTIVAVSDKGTIKRIDGWKEPQEPFRVFVAKADQVPDKINQELKLHSRNAKLTKIRGQGDYGIWNMKKPEARTVARFLAERHVGRIGVADARPALAQCMHCGSEKLEARRRTRPYYNDYWQCSVCHENTPMPAE
ncbi:MAG: nuclease-related domain-containing protein [bacterium]|nr:nuclease-related domain-containing protein [bacterium]